MNFGEVTEEHVIAEVKVNGNAVCELLMPLGVPVHKAFESKPEKALVNQFLNSGRNTIEVTFKYAAFNQGFVRESKPAQRIYFFMEQNGVRSSTVQLTPDNVQGAHGEISDSKQWIINWQP